MGQRLLEVAIVGADTIAGKDLVESLREESFPMGHLRLFGTGADQDVAELDGEEVDILPLGPGSLAGCDLIFILPGVIPDEVHLSEGLRSGATILDASGRALSPDVPLIHPGINGEDLEEEEGARLIALPSPAAAQLAAVLVPIDARARVVSVHVVSLGAVADAGIGGLDELSRQTVDLLSGKDPEREVFPQRIAFNLIPQVGALDAEGDTSSESRIGAELERLLGRPLERTSILSAWVPVFHGNTQILVVETERPLAPGAAREAFREAEGVKLLDDPEVGVVPMPMLVLGDDDVHVGRMKQTETTLRLISVADGLRFGVVVPMVRMARELLELGRLPGLTD